MHVDKCDYDITCNGHARLRGWLHGSAVERWSLTSELSLSCAQSAADG